MSENMAMHQAANTRKEIGVALVARSRITSTSFLKGSVAMSYAVKKDCFPKCAPCTYGREETRHQYEHTPSANYRPSELAQGNVSLAEPIESDNDPKGHEVGSQEERSSAEDANSKVEGGETGLGGNRRRLFLAPKKEEEREELEEDAVLFGEVTRSGKPTVKGQKERKRKEGGGDPEALS